MDLAIPQCPFSKIKYFETPNDGIKLDLGCGDLDTEGFTGVDIYSPRAKIRADFEKPLPFSDNSVKFIVCNHTAEHLVNLLPFIDECHRILMPGPARQMYMTVPRGDHWHGYGDPTHKRLFHPNTFMYWSPMWHYENDAKKWEITYICWCDDNQITVIMRPIKDPKVLKEMYRVRDETRERTGSKYIGFC